MAVTARKKRVKEFDAPPQDMDLIAMTKDGQTIEVCAAQVEHHQTLGWTLHK